jgi:hypothetical protein
MRFFDGYLRTVCGVIMIIIDIWFLISNIVLFGTTEQLINNCCIICACIIVNVLAVLPTKSFMFKEIIKRKIDNENEELD